MRAEVAVQTAILPQVKHRFLALTQSLLLVVLIHLEAFQAGVARLVLTLVFQVRTCPAPVETGHQEPWMRLVLRCVRELHHLAFLVASCATGPAW